MQELEKAQEAIKDLAKYKFWMFGYYASRWVHMNHTLPKEFQNPSPFGALVAIGRRNLKHFDD